MAEHRDEYSNAPKDPPDSVMNSRVRRAALWTYLGPLLGAIAVIAVMIFYLATRPPDRQTSDENVWTVTGTSGSQPGGHSPDPVPATPEKEIEERGVVELSEAPSPNLRRELMLTDLSNLLGARREQMIGRHVDVRGVEVVEVKDATNFVVRQGDAKVAVVAPDGSSAVRKGQRVNIVGTVERDASRGIRVQASRVDVHD
jgi:hypothetical protein